jgi:hypothetical protein
MPSQASERSCGTFKNPIEKSVKGENLISIKHKYMTAHLPGLE